MEPTRQSSSHLQNRMQTAREEDSTSQAAPERSPAPKTAKIQRPIPNSIETSKLMGSAVSPRPLEARASLLPGAGRGLFTNVEQKVGAEICRYTGTHLSLAKLLKHPDTTYVMGLSINRHVDAKGFPGVMARYINDHHDSKMINSKFVKNSKLWHAKVIALRDIRPGEEVYASYGQVYWRKRGGIPGGKVSKQVRKDVKTDD
ncbi:hypothetical protein AAMO2058_000615000 [Amorphochlora amoebiformis]